MGWYELNEYGQMDYRESEYEPDDIRYWDDIAMQQHEEDMKRIKADIRLTAGQLKQINKLRQKEICLEPDIDF